eukprot:TRINITY_DN8378_c0_g1_i1.p1 TRINITY_DN8378_c0_g1~~TRINITY_DN8378_c0_g1_i1.p1  ORF type:complete len:529 (-),score=45.10 TRINITY_DN8378_c0_g1_i1:56-1570(-)
MAMNGDLVQFLANVQTAPPTAITNVILGFVVTAVKALLSLPDDVDVLRFLVELGQSSDYLPSQALSEPASGVLIKTILFEALSASLLDLPPATDDSGTPTNMLRMVVEFPKDAALDTTPPSGVAALQSCPAEIQELVQPNLGRNSEAESIIIVQSSVTAWTIARRKVDGCQLVTGDSVQDVYWAMPSERGKFVLHDKATGLTLWDFGVAINAPAWDQLGYTFARFLAPDANGLHTKLRDLLAPYDWPVAPTMSESFQLILLERFQSGKVSPDDIDAVMIAYHHRHLGQNVDMYHCCADEELRLCIIDYLNATGDNFIRQCGYAITRIEGLVNDHLRARAAWFVHPNPKSKSVSFLFRVKAMVQQCQCDLDHFVDLKVRRVGSMLHSFWCDGVLTRIGKFIDTIRNVHAHGDLKMLCKADGLRTLLLCLTLDSLQHRADSVRKHAASLGLRIPPVHVSKAAGTKKERCKYFFQTSYGCKNFVDCKFVHSIESAGVHRGEDVRLSP